MQSFAFAALLSALLVFAGSTDTDTGTDSGTDTGFDTDSSDGFDTADCGDPCGGDQPPEILAPADGDVIESPFSVQIDAGVYCYCDTCGCQDQAFEDYVLTANGETVASESGDVTSVELSLPPGVYELVVESHGFLGPSLSSTPVTVTVIQIDGEDEDSIDGSGGSGSGSEGESGGNISAGEEAGDTGDTGSIGDSERGCGCSSADEAPVFAGLALLGLLALRRRRD